MKRKIEPASDHGLPARPGRDPNTNETLRDELRASEALFNAQPKSIQRFLEAQVRAISDAVEQRLPQVRFNLPDQVVVGPPGKEEAALVPVPAEQREQMAGGLVGRLTHGDLRAAIRQRLAELTQSEDPAVAASAMLLRYAGVIHMVYDMLPAGRNVRYHEPVEGGIPHEPVDEGLEPESAITASTDAIVEEGAQEAGRGELLVPYVPAARRFYLPQWVAFDQDDRLLVGSLAEAEAHVASMQRFLSILHAAVSLAPYVVADEEYQRKRYGMLGQLVHQGRAFSRYETREIIRTIQRRSRAGDLNRGLSLSVPYFDDQDLVIRTRDLEVIPAGRIMFVPAFVVRAAREEQAKVAQDTRLSPTTRAHLTEELRMLEEAFLDSGDAGARR
jgi:hypothetical protein